MEEEEKLKKLKEFRGMIKSIAIRYCRDEQDIFDDLVVVGEIACFKALDSFDELKNTKLSTYLYGRIDGAIRDEVKTKYKFFGRNMQSHPIPIADVEAELSYDIDDIILNRNASEQLKKSIESLSGKEKKVLWLKYWEEKTLPEIAKELNMSEPRVSQIHSKVIKKLKQVLENADAMR